MQRVNFGVASGVGLPSKPEKSSFCMKIVRSENPSQIKLVAAASFNHPVVLRHLTRLNLTQIKNK